MDVAVLCDIRRINSGTQNIRVAGVDGSAVVHVDNSLRNRAWTNHADTSAARQEMNFVREISGVGNREVVEHSSLSGYHRRVAAGIRCDCQT